MIGTFVKKLVTPSLIFVLLAIAGGIISGAGALAISDWSLYRLIFVYFLLFLLPILITATGNITRALMVGLIIALPLDFSLAPFDEATFHQGGAQPIILFFLYDFPLVGLIGIWILETLTKKKTIPKSSVFPAAIAWIVWSALSFSNSRDLTLSWFEIMRMVKLLVLMLAISTLVRDKKDIRMVYIAQSLSLLLQGVVCIVQYATGSFFNLFDLAVEYTENIPRVTGTMGWPNTAGTYYATLTAIAFILAITSADRKLRGLSLVSAVVGFISMIMTYSRGAWLSFFVALAIGVLISRIRNWLNTRDMFRLAFVGLVIVLMAFPFTSDINQRITQTDSSQGSIVDRFSLLEIAENMIRAHPLRGVGINTFVEVMRSYDTTGISYSFPQPVHNIYMLIAAETGLIGLGLFIVLVIVLVTVSAKAVRNTDRLTSLSGICVISGVTALMVSNFADVHLRVDTIFALFWFLAGLGIAFAHISSSASLAQDNLQ